MTISPFNIQPTKTIPNGKRRLYNLLKKSILCTSLVILPICYVLAQKPDKQASYTVITGKEALPQDTTAIMNIIRYVHTDNMNGRSDPDSVLALMNMTILQSRRLSFSYGIAASLLQQSYAYSAKALYLQSEMALQEAITYCLESPQAKQLIPPILNAMGRLSQIQGNFARASQFYNKALLLITTDIPDADPTRIYANYAALLSQMMRSQTTINYYLDKAELSARQKKDYYILGNILVNKAAAFINHAIWDSSLYYLQQALVVGRTYKYANVQVIALVNMGTVYLQQKQPQAALPYLEEGKKISLTARIEPAYINVLTTSLGQAYTQLGRYKDAENNLLEAQQRAVITNQKNVLRETYWNLADLYGATHDYEKAYKNSRAYLIMNDSMSGKEIIENVNEYEVKFRTAEKDKELYKRQLLITQQKSNLEHKNFWITVIVSISVIVILLSAGLYRNYRNRQHLMLEQLANLKQQQEIERLKAMMQGEENERSRIAGDLHDGIGGLIAAARLNAAVLKKENQALEQSEAYHKITDILEDIGNEVRKTAHNMMPEVLLRQNLADAIQYFCKHIRQNRNLHIEVQAYGPFEVLTDEYRLSVYRIIQELLHNIVKHAAATNVLVQVILDETILSITIEDNGQGFDISKANNGAGLVSLRTRVQSMNGTLSLQSTPGTGTSVYIEIDIAKQEDSLKNSTLQKENN